MKKVILDTATTDIVKDRYFKPTSPIYRFFNRGQVNAYINNSLQIRPGEDFGVDSSALVAAFLKADVSVENITQFQITFDNSPFIKKLVIIQTVIKLV